MHLDDDLLAAITDAAAVSDASGELDLTLLRRLARGRWLCAQVPVELGGLGYTAVMNGELTAAVGRACTSMRSLMTSQGMSAWIVQRCGTREQQAALVPLLAAGELCAVAFTEPGAGSDLNAISASVERTGDDVVVHGEKRWITAAMYARRVLCLVRDGDAAAFVVVPTDSPGVCIEPVVGPLGCRAAGHASVALDRVHLPVDAVLGGGHQDLGLLAALALTYGRFSVAWGCIGIIRACREASVRHVSHREQGGVRLAEHQLVRHRLAEMFISEQAATELCRATASAWDAGSADLGIRVVAAKYFASRSARMAAEAAVQLHGSYAASDGHVVARAYRDSKLMEVIEGSNEVAAMLVADHLVQERL